MQCTTRASKFASMQYSDFRTRNVRQTSSKLQCSNLTYDFLTTICMSTKDRGNTIILLLCVVVLLILKLFLTLFYSNKAYKTRAG